MNVSEKNFLALTLYLSLVAGLGDRTVFSPKRETTSVQTSRICNPRRLEGVVLFGLYIHTQMKMVFYLGWGPWSWPLVAGPAGGREDHNLFTLVHQTHLPSKRFSAPKNSRHPIKIASSFPCRHFRAIPLQATGTLQLPFGSTDVGICPTHFVNLYPVVMQTT